MTGTPGYVWGSSLLCRSALPAGARWSDPRVILLAGSGSDAAPPRPRKEGDGSEGREPVRRVVVLAEDEWLVRMDMADALDGAGWVVLEAGSGEEALSLLGREPQIDLLITDIRLLGATGGWDVAEAFRAIHPLIGVIYATANSAVESRLVPHSVFLSKPTRTAELTAISEQLWRDRRG